MSYLSVSTQKSHNRGARCRTEPWNMRDGKAEPKMVAAETYWFLGNLLIYLWICPQPVYVLKRVFNSSSCISDPRLPGVSGGRSPGPWLLKASGNVPLLLWITASEISVLVSLLKTSDVDEPLLLFKFTPPAREYQGTKGYHLWAAGVLVGSHDEAPSWTPQSSAFGVWGFVLFLKWTRTFAHLGSKFERDGTAGVGVGGGG